jgi:putative nucleotide binding protein
MADGATDDDTAEAGTEPQEGASGASGDAAAEDGAEYAVVLDYLAHGHPDDDRPQYQKSPIAHALGETRFRLYELTLDDDDRIGIGDRLAVAPDDARESVTRSRTIEYEDLTRGAQQELEYAIEEIVDRHERRFVDFYNDAQPITLRLHQLNLLPGIGKKLRNNVLDERKRGPYESFDDLEDRVSGLHNPKDVLVDRIVEEVREEDLKYRIFTGEETAG